MDPHPVLPSADYTIVVVAQRGRIAYEALLFAASLRHSSPGFTGRLIVAEPKCGPLWDQDPRIPQQDIRAALADLGAEIMPFENRFFGASYPHGNKIELLRALPRNAPFVFFDTDTLITGDITSVPFDFDRPSASLRRKGTWPKPKPEGPGYRAIWKALYDRFDLDFESSLDHKHPERSWKRYLYFNAGFFYYRCPHVFGEMFERIAVSIRDDPPSALEGQVLYPWLDQIALPLVIHALGGARHALPSGLIDGSVSCHYRLLPLLYARQSDLAVNVLETVAAPDRIATVLKHHEPLRRMVYEGEGAQVRALFDRNPNAPDLTLIRARLRAKGLWIR